MVFFHLPGITLNDVNTVKIKEVIISNFSDSLSSWTKKVIEKKSKLSPLTEKSLVLVHKPKPKPNGIIFF